MRTKYIRILFFLLWITVKSIAHAKCSLEHALNAVISAGHDPNDSALIDCKVIPGKQHQTVAAFAREIGGHEYTLTVLVMGKKGEIQHRFVDEDPSFGALPRK